MLATELSRLMEFGAALGIDLSGIQKDIEEKLRVLGVRDDLGFAPLNWGIPTRAS